MSVMLNLLSSVSIPHPDLLLVVVVVVGIVLLYLLKKWPPQGSG